MAGVRLLFGLAQAGCYPNLSKTTKLWFPSSERTAVQGWVASFFGRMGGATSYLLFATVLIGWCHMPWRVALGLFMLLGFAAAVGFLLFFRNSPREHPWVNAAEAHLISDNDPGAATATRSTLKWSTVLRNGSLRALVFQQFTCAYVDNFFSSWIPLFLFEQKHVKLDATGWMSALPMVGGALGGMLAGGMLQNWLILRTGNRRWSRSLIGLTGNLMAMFIMFLSLTLDSATAIAGAFFLLKFFSDWAQPTMWGATTDMGGRNAASIFALVNTAGSLAGFVAGPTMGYTIHAFSGGDATNPTGWTALFVGIGCIYLASALSWLFIDCTQTLEPPAPPPDHAATRMGVP
jgi:sugar phosphate permease